MDFTGLGKFTAYKVNRPLDSKEVEKKISKTTPAANDLVKTISVIKINSTFIEVVGRWYASKGWGIWLGGLLLIPLIWFNIAVLMFTISSGGWKNWLFASGSIVLSAPLIYFGWYGCRLENFKQTHYPIRLNRKTRKVYAFRPDGTILKTSWDNIYFCIMESNQTLGRGRYHDIRAYILGDDGVTIKDTFTLCCPEAGHKDSLMGSWELVRRYMEELDGVKNCYDAAVLCPPIDGRREGWKFGIIRAYATTTGRVVTQLLISPMLTTEIIGRWIAMYTSKVPSWPEDIEAECQVDPDDPYQKDWRDNGKYHFLELGWPIICICVGLCALVIGVTWLVQRLFY